MGSPLSAVLACLFMETLESDHCKDIIGRHSTWLRYVDDVLVIVPRRNGIMGSLSLAGNCVVIWVFMNTKALRSPANLLVVNLAISDFFMMLTMTPPLLINAYWGTWILGGFFCEIYGFLGSFFGCVSIWSMVFITDNRYVIVKGVCAEPPTCGGAMMRIAGTWTFTLDWCIMFDAANPAVKPLATIRIDHINVVFQCRVNNQGEKY
ncbi:rhodopsin-like [Penaeus vannamei]|uniref:rhodopsin-like n=1 Tax=Penaeus vannamei TaxID=6689 RepID=UPI00387F6685